MVESIGIWIKIHLNPLVEVRSLLLEVSPETQCCPVFLAGAYPNRLKCSILNILRLFRRGIIVNRVMYIHPFLYSDLDFLLNS